MAKNPTTHSASEPVLDLPFLVASTGGTVARRGISSFTGVAIDGRAVAAGGLFFAIKGDRFDGHDFAAQAVESGASGVVVARGRAKDLPRLGRASVVEVDDTVAALGRLARAHRLRFPGLRVVGVTGSNGKTTTKELLAAIFAAAAGHAAVHKTEGNLNNHLGLPLTLLGLTSAHRFAVIEMGMSGLGEIAYLAGLAVPDAGIIVNVGPVHLEQLGSIDNIARAKGELFAALRPAGCAVFPDGDERIWAQAEKSPAVRRLRFGTAPGVPVRLLTAEALLDGTEIALRLPEGEIVRARLAFVGAHNATNAAAAAAAAHALGVSPAHIEAGLGAARPAKHRSTLVDVAGRRVLDDCYNASPLSTAAALDALSALAKASGGRSIAVLGDMLELGPDELLLHRNIGARAAALGVDLLLGVGERSRATVEGAIAAGMSPDRARHLADVDEAARVAAEASRENDVILVKASRGARLERVITGLQLALVASHKGHG